MLYVIVAESLNNLIKSQPNIKGTVINDNFKFLPFQHADDTSITVQDTQSVESVISHSQYILSWYGRKSKYWKIWSSLSR